MVGQPKYTLHYYIMQYKTTCNNCKQEYIVDGEPGQTIRAKCPYCGALANIVTPADDYTSVQSGYNYSPVDSQKVNGSYTNNAVYRNRKRKSERPLFLRVTIWFLITVTILFILMTILYIVFTGMSK